MIDIDGRSGEGGGQILRTSLALSLITGKAFRMHHIRGGRRKPGLLRQHLTGVRAAATVGAATVDGAELHSSELVFEPGPVQPGDYHFAVGTAGSAVLVLQTVLPALLTASGPSQLTVEGGTHAASAPPYPYFAKTYLPVVERMGPTLRSTLVRPGFYPAGGGRIDLAIRPAAGLEPLEICDRGALRRVRVSAIVSALPKHIGTRELVEIRRRLGLDRDSGRVVVVDEPRGPGNAVTIEAECDGITEVFTGFGRKGVRAETVAALAARAFESWRDSGVPVGEHLADQLLLPMALAGGGRFVTTEPSRHTTTNIETIRRFLDVRILVEERGSAFVITVGG